MFLYQSWTISTRIPWRTTLGKPYANLVLYQANANFGALAKRPFFQIGDFIRTWRISQSSAAVSHENLDVEFYGFDHQFYKRIQLGNSLVVSS